MPFRSFVVARAAVFVACSWTWVIGMWLPVYLIGDFGVAGWVVFAVPNILGAASVGWAFAQRNRAESFLASHGRAVWWFSAVTILFHLVFAGWLAVEVVGSMRAAVPIACGVGLAGLGLSRLPVRLWGWAAPMCFVGSLALAVIAWKQGALSAPPVEGRVDGVNVLFAAPALCFGFLLCPHLDATLVAARRDLPGPAGKAAFALGFGAVFLVMIVLTMLYAGPVLATGVIAVPIALHIAVQSIFTIAAHVRAAASETPAERLPGALKAAACAGAIALGAWAATADPFRPGYPAFRLVYELLISAYGLAFPAYLWIVAIAPGARRAARLLRLRAWAAACAAATPLFWLGYIDQRYPFLVAGVAIPVAAPWVAGLLARRGTESAGQRPGEPF